MPKLTRKQIVKKLAKSDEDYNLCYENALLSLRSKAIRLGYINERHPERSNIKKYQRYEMKWLPTVIRLHAPTKNEFGLTKQDIDNRIKFAAKLKEEGVTRKNVRQYPQLKVYEPYLPEEKHQDVITKEIEDLIRKERYGIFVDLLLKKKLIS